MFGSEALDFLNAQVWKTCLDIGSGPGDHATILNLNPSHKVVTLDKHHPADLRMDFMEKDTLVDYDAVWCCHVLEHQVNPGAFLRRIRECVAPGGWVVITVPPLKHAIVGGHVTLWNQGILAYQMILAGFDMYEAKVWRYGYNISAAVQYKEFPRPHLVNDSGDIGALAHCFPKTWDIHEGFNGENP